MREPKSSEIIEAMKIFSDRCKKLDNMRDEFLNMIASLLQRIIERSKDIEKIKEEENAQNIRKKKCCVQNGEYTFDE